MVVLQRTALKQAPLLSLPPSLPPSTPPHPPLFSFCPKPINSKVESSNTVNALHTFAFTNTSLSNRFFFSLFFWLNNTGGGYGGRVRDALKDATEDSEVAAISASGRPSRLWSRHRAHMHVNKYCRMFVAIEGCQVSHGIVCIDYGNELTIWNSKFKERKEKKDYPLDRHCSEHNMFKKLSWFFFIEEIKP